MFNKFSTQKMPWINIYKICRRVSSELLMKQQKPLTENENCQWIVEKIP